MGVATVVVVTAVLRVAAVNDDRTSWLGTGVHSRRGWRAPGLSSPHPDPGETDGKLGSVRPGSSQPILSEVKQPGSGRVEEKS